MMKKFLAANAVMLLAVLSEQNAAIAAPISSLNTLAATGHVVCDTRGCQQVRKGCRLEYRPASLEGRCLPAETLRFALINRLDRSPPVHAGGS
jgi:hypothetical protein